MGWVAVAASITVLHQSKTLSIGKVVLRAEKATWEWRWRPLRHNLAVHRGSLSVRDGDPVNHGGASATGTVWLDLRLPCGRVRGISEETRK